MKLYQELFLLSIDSKGEIYQHIKNNYQYFIIASILLEQYSIGNIKLEGPKIVIKEQKVDDKLVSIVLNQLTAEPTERIAYHVQKIATNQYDNQTFESLLNDLMKKDGLTEVRHTKFLGITIKRSYKILNSNHIIEIKNKIEGIINEPKDISTELLIAALILQKMELLYSNFNKTVAKQLEIDIKFNINKFKESSDYNKILQEILFAQVLF